MLEGVWWFRGLTGFWWAGMGGLFLIVSVCATRVRGGGEGGAHHRRGVS